MDLTLPYGDRTMPLAVPDGQLLGVLTAASAGPADQVRLLRDAVEQPLQSPPLHSFIRPGDPLLILVNDATRPTPTAKMLEALRPEVGAADVEFLVATGTHRAPDDDELGHIFGRLWPEARGRIHVHDARDEGQLVRVGESSRGNVVSVNRRVAEAGQILVLGSVEAHYFAGFTGGRKIILPGVAGYETIERNHRLAIEPGAEVLRLQGNPVDEEMREAAAMLGGRTFFAVQAVLDREHNITSVHAGDMNTAFLRAAADVERLFAVPFDRKAGIVVAVATHPLDFDFYQAQKAIENGRLALTEGGTLILVSACRDGVGNDAFLRIMSEAGSPEEVEMLAADDYHLGYHKAARLAKLARRAKLRAVVGVEDAVVRRAFMEPYATAQDALDAALEARPDAGILVLMDAGNTVPVAADGGG